MARLHTEEPQTSLKRERLEARVTPEQKAILAHAAALEGRSLTDFVVSSAQQAALRAIQVHESIAMGRRDREAFVSALLNPPTPGRKLRTAARRLRDKAEA